MCHHAKEAKCHLNAALLYRKRVASPERYYILHYSPCCLHCRFIPLTDYKRAIIAHANTLPCTNKYMCVHTHRKEPQWRSTSSSSFTSYSGGLQPRFWGRNVCLVLTSSLVNGLLFPSHCHTVSPRPMIAIHSRAGAWHVLLGDWRGLWQPYSHFQTRSSERRCILSLPLRDFMLGWYGGFYVTVRKTVVNLEFVTKSFLAISRLKKTASRISAAISEPRDEPRDDSSQGVSFE